MRLISIKKVLLISFMVLTFLSPIFLISGCMSNDTEPTKCIYRFRIELVNGSIKTITKELDCNVIIYITSGGGSYDLDYSQNNHSRGETIVPGVVWFDIISKEMKL